MLSITLTETSDQDAIGRRWQTLETEAPCSFFQSWAWVGCLFTERFDAPVLLEARREGVLVAMALFNRRRRRWAQPERLWLNETGSASLDAVFMEHNGVLIADRCQDTIDACMKAALDTGRPVRLSGVSAAYLPAAERIGAICNAHQSRAAPFIDLAALRQSGTSYLASLSVNTRAQLRRSARGYAARGALDIARAETVSAAHAYFDAMGALHQATWVARGQPGAFANAHFVRFHHALIDRAYASGGIDLLCITAGDRVIGYLYNLCRGGRVSAYQSGFDYANAPDRQKPGLTCHHMAIERYRAAGADVYDFLAGGDRYKRSLSNAAETLHWLELMRAHSLLGAITMARSRMRGWAKRLPGGGSVLKATPST